MNAFFLKTLCKFSAFYRITDSCCPGAEFLYLFIKGVYVRTARKAFYGKVFRSFSTDFKSLFSYGTGRAEN